MIFKRLFPPLTGLIGMGLVLEFLVRTDFLNPALIPAPSQVLLTLWELRQDFLTAFLESLQGVVIGYVLSILLGLLMAILFSMNTFLRRSVLPFAIFFQTVPIIAVAPLLVIYFGFGQPTVIAAAFIVSIFPIIANTLVGLDSAEKNHLELFQIYHASRWQTLIKLRLPSAYRSIYTGIKISAGLAVIGAVAGEFVAGGGLGAMIDAARTQQRIDIVFAAILVLSCLGLGLILVVNGIHWGVQKWRPLGGHDL